MQNLNFYIKQAVANNDSALARNIATYLRNKPKWTYDMIYKFAYSFTGVSAADWDALLQEADK